MRYASVRLSKELEDQAYRIYLSDCLRLATENAAKMVSGSYPEIRYYDIIHPKPDVDADQIVEDVIKRAGLVVTE